MSEEYEAIRRRFDEAIRSHPEGPLYRDEDFIADAVMVFCMEYLMHPQPESLQSKATEAIVRRLMALPDLERQWRVSFPYPFMPKGNLTSAQKRARALAFQVMQRRDAGEKLTHAIAAVAAAHCLSPQKVTGDWYEWKDIVERLQARVSSKS